MSYITVLLNLVLAACLVYVAWYYLKDYFQAPQTDSPVLPFLAPEIKPASVDNHTKGVAFEKFVVGNFSPDFKVEQWRGDKYHEGLYPPSNTYPDLVMRYKPTSFDIAVECKWRQHFYDQPDERINYQVRNYKKFAAARIMKVFVVIGIGGTPHEPEKLFIVPLPAISKNCPLFSATFLAGYEKNTGNFCLDLDAMRLV